ncbi:MAG: carboxymuconolactone decarboxylase family protein [Cyclobacteriaceae bacterium]|nr:carboxymuconolactone decarboxylase family protein [Cyclobacteriaceae bacterium]
MKNLEVLNRDQVGSETQAIFDGLKQKVGMVPNLYAATANSHFALTALLDLGETLKKGNLNAKEVEAVALAVGETNQCQYCLSAHTTVGKMLGFTEDQTLHIRNGQVSDDKIRALTDLAKEITERRGHPQESTIEAFFQVGYNKGALVDVIGLVALNTFTNYLNHIADTPIDFPLAPQHSAAA